MSMGYRFMRVIVFFDLPMLTDSDVRAYTTFRKFLIKEGFVMMQKSVYTKILLNTVMANLTMDRLKQNLPPKGVVQTLLITEKQFTGISYLVGESKSIVEQSDKRLVEY